MRRTIIIAILTFSLFLTACIIQTPVACTTDAKICPDGSSVGRTSPDCEFEKCPNSDRLNNESKTFCNPNEKPQICTKEYSPVCGWFNESIKCIKYPCASTFGNKCEACVSENVAYWTDGECPE